MKNSKENSDVYAIRSLPIQIHVKEYPRNIQDRHKANIDEFSCSLDKISKFYLKLDFFKRLVPGHLQYESTGDFLKLIGGENRSKLNFAQLSAYLNLEEGNRYLVNMNNTSVIWMTFSAKTLFAVLDDMTGSFTLSSLSQWIDMAKSRGMKFRQIQTTEVHFEGFHHIFARIHFTA